MSTHAVSLCSASVRERLDALVSSDGADGALLRVTDLPESAVATLASWAEQARTLIPARALRRSLVGASCCRDD